MTDEDHASVDGIALLSASHPVRPWPWWKRMLHWATRAWRRPIIDVENREEFEEYHYRTTFPTPRAVPDWQAAYITDDRKRETAAASSRQYQALFEVTPTERTSRAYKFWLASDAEQRAAEVTAAVREGLRRDHQDMRALRYASGLWPLPRYAAALLRNLECGEPCYTFRRFVRAAWREMHA